MEDEGLGILHEVIKMRMSSFPYVTLLALIATVSTSFIVSTEVSVCYNSTSMTDRLGYVIFKRVLCNDGNISHRFDSKKDFSISALLKDVFLNPSASELPAFNNATLKYSTTDLLVTSSVTPPSFPQSESLNVSAIITLNCIPQQSSVVTSPGYPNKYNNHVSYHVTVHADAGHVIRLTFEFLNIEEGVDCMYDSIQVYDGANTTAANLTEKLCGRDIPQPITSTTNVMHVHFQTDYSVRKRGFQAVAECV